MSLEPAGGDTLPPALTWPCPSATAGAQGWQPLLCSCTAPGWTPLYHPRAMGKENRVGFLLGRSLFTSDCSVRFSSSPVETQEAGRAETTNATSRPVLRGTQGLGCGVPWSVVGPRMSHRTLHCLPNTCPQTKEGGKPFLGQWLEQSVVTTLRSLTTKGTLCPSVSLLRLPDRAPRQDSGYETFWKKIPPSVRLLMSWRASTARVIGRAIVLVPGPCDCDSL